MANLYNITNDHIYGIAHQLQHMSNCQFSCLIYLMDFLFMLHSKRMTNNDKGTKSEKMNVLPKI